MLASGVLLAALLASALVGLMVVKARRDVVSRLQVSANGRVDATFASMRLSARHVAYVHFEIAGHGELVRAYWRLYPFGEIDVSK